MKKIPLISVSIFLIMLIAVGCKNTEQSKSTKTTLSELQISACDSAHAAGTCDTRLAEVGIVLKEECCKELGKCC